MQRTGKNQLGTTLMRQHKTKYECWAALIFGCRWKQLELIKNKINTVVVVRVAKGEGMLFLVLSYC